MTIVTNKPTQPAYELVAKANIISCFDNIIGIDYLSSDLLSSAQLRMGWRENRRLPREERQEGYHNRDKERLLIHLSEFPKHLDV